jgi:hypothetical protein
MEPFNAHPPSSSTHKIETLARAGRDLFCQNSEFLSKTMTHKSKKKEVFDQKKKVVLNFFSRLKNQKKLTFRKDTDWV